MPTRIAAHHRLSSYWSTDVYFIDNCPLFTIAPGLLSPSAFSPLLVMAQKAAFSPLAGALAAPFSPLAPCDASSLKNNVDQNSP